MTADEALQRWKDLLAGGDRDGTLEEAALLYAAGEYPDLRVEAYLERLDGVAEECRGALGAGGLEGPEAGRRLCRYLFEIAGFLGNREAYDDPRNSYLNEVLDRKLGIPITLSVIGIAVGRRLGVPLEGVGMPGHFLLRSPEGPAYFDPFAGGHPVTEEECRERFQAIYGSQMTWSSAYLSPTPKREMLARMLNNLKLGYLQRSDFDRAERILNFALALEPGSSQDRELLRQIQEWRFRQN
ncbi:MAG: transglutaminase-like domain-containing protein [Armatimonadetes bacterium]|nr:transglutaminase-like domain-containing protein [Armatimonadota bacterium]